MFDLSHELDCFEKVKLGQITKSTKQRSWVQPAQTLSRYVLARSIIISPFD